MLRQDRLRLTNITVIYLKADSTVILTSREEAKSKIVTRGEAAAGELESCN